MGPAGILIVGSRGSRSLEKRLTRCGFATQVEATVQATLKSLQLRRFVAVVVDYPHAQVDIVELVLNVRDVSADLPIMILGSRQGSEAQLKALQSSSTGLLMELTSVDALIEQLGQSAESVH